MKITLDATVLLTRKFGIGYYAENLIRGLSSTDAAVRLLYRVLRDRDLPSPLPHIRRKIPHFASDLLFNRLSVRGDGFCGNPDVFHALTNFLPKFRRTRSVWTLYDLAFKVNPEWFTPATARGLDEVTRRCLDRADHVITISKSTRDDLVRFYGFPPERVTPILLGAPAHAFIADVPSPVEKPYILHVGTIEPRKNLARLIEAARGHRLVLVGARGWRSDEVFKMIDREQVTWLDYVSPATLTALYRNAEAFVYPSLYEGFGLPVLEAMAHGLPVVTSKVSSLSEVGGEAALYADPNDAGDIAAKIEEALSHKAILAEKSRAQAAGFSWDRAARETLDVYHFLTS